MVILGVGAHPDDLDFSSAGTFAKWASENHDCYYLVCTDGSKGSDNPKMTEHKLRQLRKQEQKEAAKILGVKDVFFLNHIDTQLVADLGLKKEIVRYIRKLKPDIVVTMDPTFVYSIERGFINHTDHRAAGLATLDAVFPLARDRLTFKELEKEGLSPHKVSTIYMSRFENPTEIVDISSTIDLKIKALLAHETQISEKATRYMRSFAKILGKKNGLEYAEGFVKLKLS
jgi:LmbE family N-acetylglucosaminyl deacetylase